MATYYDYDIHGNVKAIQHQIREFGAAEIHYEYELWSGNVNKVIYQPGTADQFFHRFRYDADNRLSRVQTSNDNLNWSSDARYLYYAHGPLARIELGDDKVQGLDYYYSIHGWLKGINNSSISIDPGQDGNNSSSANPNRLIPQDEMAFYLGYYEADYNPIGSNVNMGGFDYSSDFHQSGDLLSLGTKNGLYNGNIAWTSTHLPEIQRQYQTAATKTNVYQYDALQRLRKSFTYSYDSGSKWNKNTEGTDAYDSEYTYDRDGNLKTLKRNAGAYGLIDEMNYQYKVNIPNQLDYIDDSHHDASANDLQGQQAQNYDYTVLGELKSDTKECIDLIEWNSQGKVTSIVYNNSCSPGKPLVKYHYDAFGNRIWKETRNAEEDGLISRTVYIRDAGGRELATYTITPSGSNLIRELDQQAIYGLSRIGVQQHTNFVKTASCTTKICTLALADWEEKELMNEVHQPMQLQLGTGPYTNVISRGYKSYELSNHLGNVLAVVTDKKTGVDMNSDNRADFYLAKVSSVSDYYPFGWEMPGRTFNDAYRFSVNGMEKAPEIGSGHNSTYFRELDARIGRWWSTDPVWQPWQSSYCTFDNNPVALSDPSGAVAVGKGQSAPVQRGTQNTFGKLLSKIANVIGEAITGGDLDGNAGRFSWNGSGTGVGNDGTYGNTVTPGSIKTITKTDFPKLRETEFPKLRDVKENNKKTNPDWIGKSFRFISKVNIVKLVLDPSPLSSGGWYSPEDNAKIEEEYRRRELESKLEYEPLLDLKKLNPFGNDIALGLGDDLFKFAKQYDYKTYKDFTNGGIQLDKIKSEILNHKNRLHFNLTGFSKRKFDSYLPTDNPSYGNITNWELWTIYNTPGALNRTTFYRWDYDEGKYVKVMKPY